MTKLISILFLIHFATFAQEGSKFSAIEQNFENIIIKGAEFILPKEEQAKKFDTLFNAIPNDLIQVQVYLDSFIYYRHCYKFIYNSDSTKFIALFVAPFSDFDYSTFLKYNGMTRNTYFPEGENYCSYVLWGMSYNGNWYYWRDYVNTFKSKSYDGAKKRANTLLLCREIHFFKFFGTKKEDQFWTAGSSNNSKTNSNGPFDLITEENSSGDKNQQEHIGDPSIVVLNTYLFRRIELKKKERSQ
ncbi:MAG: hypothetical protein RL632_81 [Bacteroidota bacterium]|jgi:hypothetical protein